MTKTEMIRVVKAMQTQTLIQREALEAMCSNPKGPLDDNDQIEDTLQTTQNHIDGLQHILDELEAERSLPERDVP